MKKKESREIINRLFVDVFNDILQLEENFIHDKLHDRVTITEVHVMEKIQLSEKKSMGSVAKQLMITEGTLTTSINRLVQKGYIEKRRDDNDKRVYLLSITKSGLEILDIHSKFHEMMVEEVINNPSIGDNLVQSLVHLQDFFKGLKKIYGK
ncbi:MarR family transcriptional regulator [Mycoplasmatota bacterium]|nr:MarR family transcriptional regulator [Mycoplasmatota bacterium]